MVMPERIFSNEKYRWGFNGKETDNEVKGAGNSLDFGARIYDSRLGRWLSLDPLMKKYPSYSPYIYCSNNPIFFVDPDGNIVYGYQELKANPDLKAGILLVEKSLVYRQVFNQFNNSTGKYYSVEVDYIQASSRELGGATARTTVMVMYEGKLQKFNSGMDVGKIKSYSLNIAVDAGEKDLNRTAVALNDELNNHASSFAKIIADKSLSPEERFELISKQTPDEHHNGLYDPNSDYNKVNEQVAKSLENPTNYTQKVPSDMPMEDKIRLTEAGSDGSVNAPNKSGYNSYVSAVNNLADSNKGSRKSEDVKSGQKEYHRVKFRK